MTTPEELLARIASDDREAFRLFYEAFKIKVYNTALSYTHDASDAEEITQDVFLEVWRSAKTFSGKSSVGTWVYRIVINRSLDHFRHKKRKKRAAIITSLFDRTSGRLLHDPSDFIHPGIELERREDAKLLFEAIESLSEQQKTAFILTQIENLSQQEASDVMSISVGAVESLLQRAKANLRKKLESLRPE